MPGSNARFSVKRTLGAFSRAALLPPFVMAALLPPAVMSALLPTVADAAEPETDILALRCPLTVPTLEGDSYLDVGIERADLTDGKPGAPLLVRLQVVDARTCLPLPGRAVDLWSADALGVFSGFDPGNPGDLSLRGTQRTNAAGFVEFLTLYPGWTLGSAPHLHFKVHLFGNRSLTSRLYFEDALSSSIHAYPPYSLNPLPRTTNAGDPVLQFTPGAVPSLFPLITLESGTLVATHRIGVLE